MKNTTLCYIETPAGEYLMLHRVKKENDCNHDKWIGVGGKFEDGESPEECVLRETLEETGLTLTDYRYRGIVTFVSDRWEPEYMHMFTDTGFWDTFRSLFPFLNLMYPSMNEKMQEGLVNAYKESGFLPEWASPGHRGCMVGNNSASVVADAYLKGLRGYDAETLWEAVKHGANAGHPKVSATGRLGFEEYNSLGYVPCDKHSQSVARTLEYAYDDWCIYRFGKALGKSDKELKQYRTNAMNYKNVFDSSTSLMRGRKADGSFESPFDPTAWSRSFTEGDSWHWSWCVFHDPQGLIGLMGG